MTNLDGSIDITLVISGSKLVQVLDRNCNKLPQGNYKVRVTEIVVEEEQKNI